MIKKATEKARRFLEQPVNKAFDALAGLLKNHDSLEDDEKHVMALIRAAMPAGGADFEHSLARFVSILEQQDYSERKIQYIIEFLRSCAPGTPEAALPALQNYSKARQIEFLQCLMLLVLEQHDGGGTRFGMIAETGRALGFDTAELEALEADARAEYNHRSKIIKSGTGIILALVVIAVFVMAATWLSSVLFGLALAYMFLPLEQFFERKLKEPPSLFARTISRIGRVLFPFGAVRRYFLRRKQPFALSDEERKRREQKAVTTQATTLTVSCVVAGGLAVLILLLVLAGNYFATLGSNFSSWMSAHRGPETAIVRQAAPPEADSAPAVKSAVATPTEEKSGEIRPREEAAKGFGGIVQGVSEELIGFLNNLKQRFQELPLVSSIISELATYLDQDQAQKQLAELLLKKSGGLFAFLAGFAARFAALLLNILLTFFFFSLFLSKIAGFTNDSANAGLKSSSYLIRTVFNGKWLPRMSENNLQEGDRIVGEVINKLRIWLRGYLTMIAIDFCVYGTVFHLLHVPYAPVLAAVAAVGILLPYIGPVSSALLTVLVTLAVGGPAVSALQIAGIVAIYLIHNGIIEQFFIYPWIIGESLGLTTLETIIVVLLGGILAGIPGMIFALPTAAVIKYLVPQIYRCWK